MEKLLFLCVFVIAAGLVMSAAEESEETVGHQTVPDPQEQQQFEGPQGSAPYRWGPYGLLPYPSSMLYQGMQGPYTGYRVPPYQNQVSYQPYRNPFIPYQNQYSFPYQNPFQPDPYYGRFQPLSTAPPAAFSNPGYPYTNPLYGGYTGGYPYPTAEEREEEYNPLWYQGMAGGYAPGQGVGGVPGQGLSGAPGQGTGGAPGQGVGTAPWYQGDAPGNPDGYTPVWYQQNMGMPQGAQPFPGLSIGLQPVSWERQ